MNAARSESEACDYIIDLVYKRCGIRLHQGKEGLIRSRLGKRMRLLGFEQLGQYCHFLRTSAGPDELQYVVEALTTNFTGFLRERDHFDTLVHQALPALLATGQKQFRIWSAACSTGEEPYTIAFYFSEHFSPLEGWDWRITASDVATKVLSKARLGIYAQDRLQMLPPGWLARFFQRGTGKWDGYCRVKANIAGRVSFECINLNEVFAHRHLFEAIFCRNVMIYFARETQKRIVRELCRWLVPRGYLFVGHSESLNGFDAPLHCIRPSVYQKTI